MGTIIKHPKSSVGLLLLTSLLLSGLCIASGYQPRLSSLSAKIRRELVQEKDYGGDVRKISKAPTCPDEAAINPCTCDLNSDANAISLFCHSISSDAELADIFQQEFPQNDFNILNIEDSTLEALTPGIFGNKTFKEITIWTSGLQRVESDALSSSYSRLTILRLDGNNIYQFPFEDLPLLTALAYLDLSFNSLAGFPNNLVSSSLRYLYLKGNNIGFLPVDVFQQLPMLMKTALGSNGIAEVLPGTFTGLPLLYSVGLNNNTLTELLAGTIELNGTSAQVFFSDNKITKVEVNAFTGASVQVVANSNSLETLEEEVWRPSLENSAELFVENNPLLCGCDIAWILRNPDFLVLVSGNCADGTAIQDLDPADFTEC